MKKLFSCLIIFSLVITCPDYIFAQCDENTPPIFSNSPRKIVPVILDPTNVLDEPLFPDSSNIQDEYEKFRRQFGDRTPPLGSLPQINKYIPNNIQIQLRPLTPRQRRYFDREARLPVNSYFGLNGRTNLPNNSLSSAIRLRSLAGFGPTAYINDLFCKMNPDKCREIEDGINYAAECADNKLGNYPSSISRNLDRGSREYFPNTRGLFDRIGIIFSDLNFIFVERPINIYLYGDEYGPGPHIY